MRSSIRKTHSAWRNEPGARDEKRSDGIGATTVPALSIIAPSRRALTISRTKKGIAGAMVSGWRRRAAMRKRHDDANASRKNGIGASTGRVLNMAVMKGERDMTSGQKKRAGLRNRPGSGIA
jgi:hypothetical protein